MLLTPKQLAVLRFVRDYQRSHSLAPKLSEIADSLGCAKITVHEHLTKLVEKGAVFRLRSRPRGVRVLVDPDAPAELGDVQARIPVLGTLASGTLTATSENFESIAALDLVPHGHQHALVRVEGVWLESEHVVDGDILILALTRPDRPAVTGDTVLAVVDHEDVVLKRLECVDGGWRLHAPKSDVPPLFRSRVRVLGVVEALIRRGIPSGTGADTACGM